MLPIYLSIICFQRLFYYLSDRLKLNSTRFHVVAALFLEIVAIHSVNFMTVNCDGPRNLIPLNYIIMMMGIELTETSFLNRDFRYLNYQQCYILSLKNC